MAVKETRMTSDFGKKEIVDILEEKIDIDDSGCFCGYLPEITGYEDAATVIVEKMAAGGAALDDLAKTNYELGGKIKDMRDYNKRLEAQLKVVRERMLALAALVDEQVVEELDKIVTSIMPHVAL